MKNVLRNKEGFTLVELLIVIIIIGILAAIAVPQFTSSTLDAQESTLVSNLASVRNAIELYYHQHNGVYPGAIDDTDGAGAPADAATAAVAFVKQLTTYTDAKGKASASLDRTNYPYGPYLKTGVPANPIMDVDVGASPVPTAVAVDLTATGAITPDAAPVTGWKFAAKTGQFIANNDDASSSGAAYNTF
ncbi:MAG: prepilin-type N-terminal cleavage/methylation domain-containing protein [Candidatus Methylomirabilis sp.]|nr:prepilin-type N-terminal cleavage/methylation domain-containing protein [Deltaproteobacteria bacterium]